MRNQLTLMTLGFFALAALVVVAGPLGAAPQDNGSLAVVDNARVFDESNQGRAATQQIQANVDTWQSQLQTLDGELQTLMQQRQSQGSIMTPEALNQLNVDIEQKQLQLQRTREDAQRQAQAIQAQVLADLEGTLTPVVEALSSELGYTAVLNSQTPGLLHFNETIDITDQLIERLNAMDMDQDQ